MYWVRYSCQSYPGIIGYAHLTALRGDTVNTRLLGMDKIVSDSSAINALKRMDETAAIDWLQTHLHQCYEPLLGTCTKQNPKPGAMLFPDSRLEYGNPEMIVDERYGSLPIRS